MNASFKLKGVMVVIAMMVCVFVFVLSFHQSQSEQQHQQDETTRLRQQRRRRNLASTCTGAPCAIGMCRSKWGYCGVDANWCNAESTWTPSCSGGGSSSPTRLPTTAQVPPTTARPTNLPTTKLPTRVPTRLPSKLPSTRNPTSKSPTLGGVVTTKSPSVVSSPPPSTQSPTNVAPNGCVGAACDCSLNNNWCSTSLVCRSEWGYCGTGTSYCNAKSTWKSVGCAPTPTTTTMTTLSPSTSSPIATSNSPSANAPPTTANTGAKQVGSYFAEWSIYGRQFYVKTLHTSGQAGKLTFLNYAFANIYKKADGTFRCDASVLQSESGGGDGGDRWAAYAKGFAAQESVDGVADAWGGGLNGDQPLLKGNFNQIKKLKQMYPNLRVLISLGGWTWSKWFSDASKTDALRKTLVSSCVEQYIKGNLPVSLADMAGGVGVGLGVFDGIDIDWEYPGVQGVGYNSVDPANDGNNMVLLFQEFRRQLNAFSATQNNKRFFLTAAVGAGLEKIAKTNVAQYTAELDWVNVMSYDYHGGWEGAGPTDFQSNLYIDKASPYFAGNPDFCTSCAVKNLVQAGAPKNKINIGVPFYGRGWKGVGATNNGLYQPASGAASGTYENGIEDYKVLRNAPGTLYFHATTNQTYKYNAATGVFWSYDTPEVVALKAKYVKDNQLGGIFAWESDGDYNDELTAAMASVNQ